jgi:uncharacterized membrane protein YuzA (DUF378 family)
MVMRRGSSRLLSTTPRQAADVASWFLTTPRQAADVPSWFLTTPRQAADVPSWFLTTPRQAADVPSRLDRRRKPGLQDRCASGSTAGDASRVPHALGPLDAALLYRPERALSRSEETTMESTSTTRNAVVAALVLAIIGSINWLLVGLFRFNLVSAIFGEMSALTRIIYVLVGIAGLYLIASAKAFLPRVSERGGTTVRRQPVA